MFNIVVEYIHIYIYIYIYIFVLFTTFENLGGKMVSKMAYGPAWESIKMRCNLYKAPKGVQSPAPEQKKVTSTADLPALT